MQVQLVHSSEDYWAYSTEEVSKFLELKLLSFPYSIDIGSIEAGNKSLVDSFFRVIWPLNLLYLLGFPVFLFWVDFYVLQSSVAAWALMKSPILLVIKSFISSLLSLNKFLWICLNISSVNSDNYYFFLTSFWLLTSAFVSPSSSSTSSIASSSGMISDICRSMLSVLSSLSVSNKKSAFKSADMDYCNG